MSQLELGVEPEEPRPALSERQAEMLGLTFLGFARRGRWESGAKVPPKVVGIATEVASAAVKILDERLRAAGIE